MKPVKTVKKLRLDYLDFNLFNLPQPQSHFKTIELQYIPIIISVHLGPLAAKKRTHRHLILVREIADDIACDICYYSVQLSHA